MLWITLWKSLVEFSPLLRGLLQLFAPVVHGRVATLRFLPDVHIFLITLTHSPVSS